MKPEELRIGNLLNYYGQEVIVLSVSRDRADFGYYPDSVGFERLFKPTDGPSDIPKPIPLSPEWLERFGFESTVMADYHHIKSNILLHSGHHEFWFGWNIGLNTKVEYVHQLQNLYYSLTSEELELKS